MMTGGVPFQVWLEAVLDQSQALLLDGPPGIGKTHRWSVIVDAALLGGRRVLRAQPAQAETRLVGSALIDLCDGITDDEIALLPGAQATALSAALLRTDGADVEPNPQAVALAFTSLIRMLSAEAPVLICVDDLQWLDAQTAGVLVFTARRLPPAGVGVLLSLRTEPAKPEPEVVADLVAALPVTRWTVPPMDDTDLAFVVRARLGSGVPAAVLRTAIGSSGGNPLYGIEVARALLERDPNDATGAVPIPASLTELVMGHLTALPDETRLGLAAASALRKPSLRQLRELGIADSLPAAERAGLIRIYGHDIAFTHPIYAAAAYDVLAPTERMQLHTRLATVVQGDEERARHLALGADEADDTVAAALDLARERALHRGAIHAALDACELSVRATPSDSPALIERQTRLGQLLFRVGETARARSELTAAAAAATDSVTRARALHALGRVVNDSEGAYESIPIELQALSLAAGDIGLQADIHMGLAISYAHDWDDALVHAETACALLDADPDADPLKVAAALSAKVGAAFYAGAGADLDACRRAVALEGDTVTLPVADRALSVLFYLQMWIDDYDGARKQLKVALDLAEDEGDEPSKCYTLANLANLEFRAGRWDVADQEMAKCVELSTRSQIGVYTRTMRLLEGWLAACRGDIETAFEIADEEIGIGQSVAKAIIEQRGLGLRGFCALARGDATAAAVDLDRYIELFEVPHAREPGLRLLAGDHIEALVGAGRLDDAAAALARMVEPAQRLGRTAVLASAARAEALLLAEQGNAEQAVAAAERSLELYDKVERRFERARALLTKGQVHRRLKQKSLARRELTAALAEFEIIGAAGFAERARSELGRVGLRPAAALDLTETERQIAELTATGLTSAEIATRLFLSTKTVSANLTRIYRKLGVRNRAELAASLGARVSD
jgi:DNA-binding CsgD family transcriptional regulator